MTYAMEPILGPIPRDLRVELVCDADHGLFAPPTLTFTLDPGESQPDTVRATGWSITDKIRCPACMKRPNRETLPWD